MIDIKEYGFTDFYGNIESDKYIVARVTAVHKERYELISEHGTLFGYLKSSVYFYGGKFEFPTTGDFVLIDYNENGDSTIVETLKRKTFFSRKDPDKGKGEQAVAANFDYVFIMQSLNNDFNPSRIERYLTLAWQSGATPVIILTKADLVDDIEDYLEEIEDIAIGVDIVSLSSFTQEGFENLDKFLSPNTTIVLLGSSGVGKSSLVNALAGEDIMSVSGIREDDSKGRHTTTHRQLVRLTSGVMIIDTPGMRELGMWDITTGLKESFEDVEEFFNYCRFADCKHQAEPNCGVKEALKTGQLSEERWKSYLKLKREAMYTEDKAAFFRSKQAWHKAISEQNRKSK